MESTRNKMKGLEELEEDRAKNSHEWTDTEWEHYAERRVGA